MNDLNGLALCTVNHIEWNSDDGNVYKGMLMIPTAGKIPNKRILYIPFLSGMENAHDGDHYLMSILETKQDEKFGRRFQWTTVGRVQDSELPLFIKELGPPTIVNVENGALSSNKEENWLQMEKLRFEIERKYFKGKAHIRHLQKELDALYFQMNCAYDDFQESDAIYYEGAIIAIKNKISTICSQINIPDTVQIRNSDRELKSHDPTCSYIFFPHCA